MISTEEARKKWIDALKSDKYPQTTGYLHRIDENDRNPVGYCCLGVACDLFAEELNLHRDKTSTVERFDNEQYALPEKVFKLLKLNTSDGQPDHTDPPNSGKLSLVLLNDSGKSFREIALALETGIYWRK